MPEFVIRPVKMEDLGQVFALAEKAKPNLTNLLPERDLLAHKIEWSIHSFSKKITAPDHELYFFVMEEVRSGKIIGTCGIFSNVGDEFYCFREYVENDQRYLQLANDYKAVSELGLLLMDETHRKMGLGKVLSRSRYLFLADNLDKFQSRVIALMRGNIDPSGRSAFWDALGSHFVNLTFAQADHLSAENQIQFVTELLPHTPIPIALLSHEAQNSIGQAHHFTQAAVKVLKEEGFEYSHYIDLFDGGPILEANMKDIKTISESKTAQVSAIQATGETVRCMISFQSDVYRITTGEVSFQDDGTLNLSPELARILRCGVGDRVRLISL